MYGSWPPFEDHGFRAYVDTFAARARSKATALSDEELSRTSEQDLALTIMQGIAPRPIVLREKDVATDAASAKIVTFTVPFDGTPDILKYRALEWNGDGTIPSAIVEAATSSSGIQQWVVMWTASRQSFARMWSRQKAISLASTASFSPS